MESPGLFLDQGDWIPTGGEGFGKIRGVGVVVEVVRMAADPSPPSGKGIRDRAFG